VLAESDRLEIARRTEALQAELQPVSEAGQILVRQMASLSVRVERASEQESAAIAHHVRHAVDDFDEERIEAADRLFEGLEADLRNNLRKLRKSPEGVDRMIEEWQDLRLDLTMEPAPEWSESHLERAARLLGLKARHARGCRLGALSRGFWGDFEAMGEFDGGELDPGFRKDWARVALIEQIDAEIADLETHRATLDHETIELDRAEAGARSLFDPSRPASLARRYETEARRGFFKALKELRLVEAEVAATAEPSPVPPTPTEPGRSGPGMGSSRFAIPTPPSELSNPTGEALSSPSPLVRGSVIPVAPTFPASRSSG